MPVMGPGEPPDAKVDEFYNSVLDFIKTQHRIQVHAAMYPWDEHREKANGKLRDALKEILTLDWYEGF